MTDDEHIARAMLLGFRFNRVSRYYFRKDYMPDRIDCDTLEPVSLDEAVERGKRYDRGEPVK